MEAQAIKCGTMVKQLQKKFPEQSGRDEKPATATYEVYEPVSLKKPVVEQVKPETEEAAIPEKELSPIEFKL
jgi:hypothetical protein